MGICREFHRVALLLLISRWNLEGDFYGGRNTGEPEKKPSKHGKEPTNNSTHKLRHQARWGPSLGRLGERQARSHHYATHTSKFINI